MDGLIPPARYNQAYTSVLYPPSKKTHISNLTVQLIVSSLSSTTSTKRKQTTSVEEDTRGWEMKCEEDKLGEEE